MHNYLFISNSSKPSHSEAISIEPINPDSFSEAAIWAANNMNWKLNLGVNRKFPELIKSTIYDIKFYNQNTFRNIFDIKNIWIAYKNLTKYLKNNPEIDIIHCNTPIGGFIGRLVGKKFNKKIIYTAHGFHFYKGASFFNKFFIKSVEKYLAKHTDVLITINEEDYQAAQKLRLKPNGKVFKISGVGINLQNYININSQKLLTRQDLFLSDNDFICICAGYLNSNKNFKTVIKAIYECNDPSIQLLICGIGSKLQSLKKLSKKLGIEKQIHFLGYRKDIKELMQISNCAIIPSLREGLPRITMEAMASNLPCIVSDIRGNRDLIVQNKGGYLIHPKDVNSLASSILKLKENLLICKQMGEYNKEKIREFDIDKVKFQLTEIFKKIND